MSIEEFPKIYSLKSALKNIERKNNKISNYKGIAYEESNFEKPNSEENNFKITTEKDLDYAEYIA